MSATQNPMMSCHAVDNDSRTLVTIDASALVEEKNSVFDGNRNKFVFVLDFSLSMEGSIDYLVGAMKDLVDEMALGSVFCIIAFHQKASVIFSTNEFCFEDRAKCHGALSEAAGRLGPATNIHAGIELASKTMLEDFGYDRNQVHMLILTDGAANQGQTCYAALAAMADSCACTVHSCMFGRQSAAQFSARLNEINPVHSGHFIQSSDSLKTAFTSIFQSMKADSIFVKVGEATKTIPPSAATGTLHLVFDVDPKSNPQIELKIGEDDAKFKGTLDKFLGTGVDERVLKMHVRIADAYAKVSSVVTELKTASATGDEAGVGGILEAFEEITVVQKDIEEEFESIDVKNEAAYRSLASVCEKVCSVGKAQPPVPVDGMCMDDDDDDGMQTRGLGLPHFRSMATFSNNGPQYRSAVCPTLGDDDDEEGEAPHYRSLSVTALSASSGAQYRSFGSSNASVQNTGGSMLHKIQGLPTLVF